MQFPVSNKEEAYIKVFAMILLLICGVFLFYFIFKELFIFYILGVLLIFTFSYSLFFIRKQNVKSLILKNDTLIVHYSEKVLHIHINKINDIYSGIGGLDFRLNMSKRYVLLLDSDYPFGNKLRITYRDANPGKSFLEEDPQEIRILKKLVENLGRCESLVSE
jgi:hypothetical protein